MKRRFIPGLVLAAAFTLTNCSEQLVSPEKENDIIVDETVQTPNEEGERIPYVIYADIPVTKTIANSNGTYWHEDDKVTVYTKTGDSFTCQEEFEYLGNKMFEGEVGTLTGNETWYCIYPHNDQNSVASGISAKVVIGDDSGSGYTQTQNAVNSKTHIAGENCPMYGVTSETPSGENITPEFSMSHLSALVAVKLVNTANNPITIEQIRLEAADQKIVGDFTLGFDSENKPTLTAGTSSSKTAILNLRNGGDAIQPNSEGLFYLAVAPVTDEFTIYINGAAKTNAQTITLKSGMQTTLKVTIPELQGTALSNTKLGDKEFIEWPDNTTTVVGTVNGAKAIINTVPANGVVSITGTLGDFLGATAEESVLPISFYAATPKVRNSSGELNTVTLSLSSIRVADPTGGGLVNEEIEGTIFKTKFGFDVSFPLSYVEGFPDFNNIILFNEGATHYYLSESKANGLLTKALSEAGISFVIDDLRSALYDKDAESWQKVLDLAKKYAPGQFSVQDGGGAATTSDLGGMLLQVTDPAVRDNLGYIMSQVIITVTLKADGDMVLWGMNVQSKDEGVNQTK